MRLFHAFSTIVRKLAYSLTNYYFTTITISKKANSKTWKKCIKVRFLKETLGEEKAKEGAILILHFMKCMSIKIKWTWTVFTTINKPNYFPFKKTTPFKKKFQKSVVTVMPNIRQFIECQKIVFLFPNFKFKKTDCHTMFSSVNPFLAGVLWMPQTGDPYKFHVWVRHLCHHFVLKGQSFWSKIQSWLLLVWK